jgi:hypothetical protein
MSEERPYDPDPMPPEPEPIPICQDCRKIAPPIDGRCGDCGGVVIWKN